MPKIQRLSVGLQNANNLRIRAGYADNRALIDDIATEAEYLDAHLTKFIADCRAASTDRNLTEVGRQVEISRLRDVIIEVIKRADKTSAMETTIAGMRGDLSKRAEKQREKNRDADSVVNYMKAAEVRRYLTELRESAKAAHEAKLASTNSAFLSDQDRVFVDPVEAMFIEGCTSYDGDKEAFLLAVEKPPFPMRVLAPEIVQRGLSALERAVTPELANAIDQQATKHAMYKKLLEQVGDIVERPLAQAVPSGPRPLVVNGGAGNE